MNSIEEVITYHLSYHLRFLSKES